MNRPTCVVCYLTTERLLALRRNDRWGHSMLDRWSRALHRKMPDENSSHIAKYQNVRSSDLSTDQITRHTRFDDLSIRVSCITCVSPHAFLWKKLHEFFHCAVVDKIHLATAQRICESRRTRRLTKRSPSCISAVRPTAASKSFSASGVRWWWWVIRWWHEREHPPLELARRIRRPPASRSRALRS